MAEIVNTARWLSLPLLALAYAWQGITYGWLHWGAIACAVLFMLNLLSLVTTQDKP